jgi:hypothetical protein
MLDKVFDRKDDKEKWRNIKGFSVKQSHRGKFWDPIISAKEGADPYQDSFKIVG